MVQAKVFGVVGVDRLFALKRISPSLTADPAVAQALSAAARAYGGLEHPRIARLVELAVTQGQTYTVTELVEGLDVGRLVAECRISGTPLPPGSALGLLVGAARAVGHAHGRGLLHLGLCPQNLVVTADGDVKVTDFGILASCLPPRPAEEPRLAHRVAYLAPEQLTGEATSAATDVFALGALGIEMVTGLPAFRGETPLDVQRAVLAGQVQDPSLPGAIVRVLQRCLARMPFERFPDARAFADALEAALRASPVRGGRLDAAERVGEVLAHLAALKEGGLSGVVSLPSSAPPVPSRPPTVLSPEVIATPTSLPDRDRAETAEFLRDDDMREELEDEEPRLRLDDTADEPEIVAVPRFESLSRPHRVTDAPVIAATLRGLGSGATPRPMPPSPSGPIATGGTPRPMPVAPSAPVMASVRPPVPAVAAKPPPPLPAAALKSGPLPSLRGAPAARVEAPVAQVEAPVARAEAPVAAPVAQVEAAAVDAGEPAPAASIKESLAGLRPGPVGPPPSSQHEVVSLRAGDTPWSKGANAVEPITARGGEDEPPPRVSSPPPKSGRLPSLPGSRAASSFASVVPARPQGDAEAGEPRDARSSAPSSRKSAPLLGEQRPRGASEPADIEVTTARVGALVSAWDEAMETFEQPTRVAQPLQPSLLSQAARTGPAPRLDLAELLAPEAEVPVRTGAGDPVPVRTGAGDPDPWAPIASVSTVFPESVPKRPSGLELEEAAQAPRPRSISDSPLRSALEIPKVPPTRPSQPPPLMGAAQPAQGLRGQGSGPTAQPVAPGGHMMMGAPPSFGAPPLAPSPYVDSSSSRARWLWLLVGVLIVVGSVGGAYVLFFGGLTHSKGSMVVDPSTGGTGKVAAAPAGDARAAAVDASQATAPAADATPPTAAAADAAALAADATQAPAAPADAGAMVAVTPSDAGPSAEADGLLIESVPPGARVYIDGAEQGVTPVQLPAADRHSAVLFLAGHELATLEVAKAGKYTVQLKEITPLGGPAGIKVRCKLKDRYYILIDGKHTGSLCPSERLEVERGEHAIETYDLVTEARRQFRVMVKDTSRSTRVRVD